MKVLRTVVLAVAVMPWGPGGYAHASDPTQPTVAKMVTFTVQAGDRLDQLCADSESQTSTTFYASSFDSGGFSAGRGQTVADVSVHARVGTSRYDAAVGGSSGGLGWGTSGSTFIVDRAGTFRAAWAGWDGAIIHCTFEVNGTRITPTDIPSDHGAFLRPADFTGGAGASVSPPLVEGVPSGAGVMVTYDRVTSGYLFAWFDPGQGMASVTGPEGESVHGEVIFATPTNGSWHYALDATTQTSLSGGVLWLLELPS